MNGLIVVNKPSGLTSHDVVNKIRKIFHTKRVGHLGTLDPMATGVLVVCINDATKLVQFLEHDSKDYIAELTLGIKTDTLDLEGTVLEEKEVSDHTIEEINATLESFKGPQKQVPPMYSAIKVNGKKLYEYARAGKTIEVEPRDINIQDIHLILEETDLKHNKISFFANVSKGTYIRSLCSDIANSLNEVGLMSNLKRVRSGVFTIENSSTLEDIELGNYRLYTMKEAVQNLPIINDKVLASKARDGVKLALQEVETFLPGLPKRFALLDNDDLVAIYDLDENIYRVARVWN